MRTVYKFEITNPEATVIQLPPGYLVRHVDMQGQALCLWIELETTRVRFPVTFIVRGTGHEVPAGVVFVGTVMNAPFVWHVYGH